MTLEGIVGGVAVSRAYSNCYSDTTARWERLLGAIG
jgi:hypothetical protein